MKNLKFVVLIMCHIEVKNVKLNVVHFMNLAENKEQQKHLVLLNDQACLIHDHIKEWQKPGWGKI